MRFGAKTRYFLVRKRDISFYKIWCENVKIWCEIETSAMFSHQKGAGFLKEGKNNVSQKKLHSWPSKGSKSDISQW